MSPEAIERTLDAAVAQIGRGKGHLPLSNEMLELIHGGQRSTRGDEPNASGGKGEGDLQARGQSDQLRNNTRSEGEVEQRRTTPASITPISANRWYSLSSSKKDGKEDYFSSDLSEEQYRAAFAPFRSTGRELLMLYCGEDEHVPRRVDKEALLGKFVQAATSETRSGEGTEGREKGKGKESSNAGQSAILEGADHGLSDEKVQDEFIERVCAFVGGL